MLRESGGGGIFGRRIIYTLSTDHRLALDDLPQIFQEIHFHDLYDLYVMYDLAHVVGWTPYNLNNLGHISSVGSLLVYLQTRQIAGISQRQIGFYNRLSSDMFMYVPGSVRGVNRIELTLYSAGRCASVNHYGGQ